MRDYLDSMRRDGDNSSFVSSMQLVDEGTYPVQWVRQALAEGLRNLADTWRKIANTPDYRFTEGRSVSHYLHEAGRCEGLAEEIKRGREFGYAGRVIPAVTEPFSI